MTREAVPVTDSSPALAGSVRSQPRVLVVDDDAAVRDALERFFVDAGFTVVLAEDGNTGLEQARAQRPDVVVTDVQMPGIDGLDLCKRLHENDPDLPVIIATGLSDTDTAVSGLRARAVDFLLKPLDLSQVLRSVQRALETRALLVEKEQLRLRAEALFEQANFAARRSEEIVAVVSHDLGNPLQVLELAAESLLRSTDESARSVAPRMLRATARMKRLIADLFDDAKLREGKLRLLCSNHRLSDLLEDVQELRPLALQRGARLEVLVPSYDAKVFCDRARIGQVLSNLVGNAIKFSPKGGAVTVSTAQNESEVQFIVRDEGPGISIDDLPRIFDRYWQSGVNPRSGMGLGLFIAQQVAYAHDGTIRAESEVGKGCIFYVTLPLVPATDAANFVQSTGEPNASPVRRLPARFGAPMNEATTTIGHATSRSKIVLHGRPYTFRSAGSGPLIVLLHGIAGSSSTWEQLIPRLSESHRVIAPDLLGHGESAKPPGDYSLGAYANLIRDLLEALGEERATIVGHSLGGGVAMQFAYQYPERCERIVLVSSGGLGRELHPLLRAAALPGAKLVLPWLSAAASRAIGASVKVAGVLGLRSSADLAQTWRSFVALGQPDARRAFLTTVRGIIDVGGQRVSAVDKLYLTSDLPTLIVWGERDPLIPVTHAYRTHERMSHSRLEVFPGAGHYPYLDDPERFASVLLDFMRTTQAHPFDADWLRKCLRAGSPPTVSGLE